MTLALSLTLILSIVALSMVARIAFMCLFRTPVLATLVSHDYSRELRDRDKDFYLLDLAKRNSGVRFGAAQRRVTLRVDYSYGGAQYRRDIRTTVRRGCEPSRLISLWIDPANPANVTVTGPGHWFVRLLVVVIITGAWRADSAPMLDGKFPWCMRPECLPHTANELKLLQPEEWHKHS